VAVAGRAPGHCARTVRTDLHLARFERFDHALALGHAPYPFVGFDAHAFSGVAACAAAQGRKIPALRASAPAQSTEDVFFTEILAKPRDLLRGCSDRRPAVLRATSR